VQRYDVLLQLHPNNLGTYLSINHRQLSIVARQLLVYEAGVEVVARTLEIIPKHDTMSLQFAVNSVRKVDLHCV